MSSVLSPNKHSRHQEFLSLMIGAKRLSASSYQQVTKLNLSNLQLVKIDVFPFKSLPNLVSIDFSYNQLVSIDIEWARDQPNAIENLNFSHNKLETFLFIKDFRDLKSLNITENLLKTRNERFLLLQLCPKLESLIDANDNQYEDDQLRLDQWNQLMESKIDRLWVMSYNEKYRQETKPSIAKKILDEFRHSMFKIIEKHENFFQIHLSSVANYVIDKKIEELSTTTTTTTSATPTTRTTRRTLRTHLTSEFSQLCDTKSNLELYKYIRCHQHDENDLNNVAVRMAAFEPSVEKPLLATCGGEKVCFIDCQTGDVTHIYEVANLRSTVNTGRKIKDKAPINLPKEYFSCLCWIQSHEHRVLAVGASNGHVYLISAQHKLMFGHIEFANSSIRCLTWHPNDPTTLFVGSNRSIRVINIESYLQRFQSFIKNKNQLINLSMCETKYSIKENYQFDHDVTNIMIDFSKNERFLLVGTVDGLFVIEGNDPVKLSFPKSMSLMGQHIESISLVDQKTDLIAMTILGLDQVCCFDLDQTLKTKQVHVCLTFPSPARQLSCQMSIQSQNDENGISFQCILPTDHGSFCFHHVRVHSNVKQAKKLSFEHKRTEVSWSPDKASQSASILSTCFNDQYLCVTSNNNLICIYQRKSS